MVGIRSVFRPLLQRFQYRPNHSRRNALHKQRPFAAAAHSPGAGRAAEARSLCEIDLNWSRRNPRTHGQAVSEPNIDRLLPKTRDRRATNARRIFCPRSTSERSPRMPAASVVFLMSRGSSWLLRDRPRHPCPLPVRSSCRIASFCRGEEASLLRMPAITVAMARSLRFSGMPRWAQFQPMAASRRSIVKRPSPSCPARRLPRHCRRRRR